MGIRKSIRGKRVASRSMKTRATPGDQQRGRKVSKRWVGRLVSLVERQKQSAKGRQVQSLALGEGESPNLFNRNLITTLRMGGKGESIRNG